MWKAFRETIDMPPAQRTRMRFPMRLRDLPERLNEISGIILDAGIEVHRPSRNSKMSTKHSS